MPDAAADLKSPKPQRRSKTGGDLPRQVHFTTVEDASESNTRSNTPKNINTGQTPTNAKTIVTESSQPTSFPQVGAPPGHGHVAAAGTQWHTSTDPSRSLPLPGQPQTLPGCFALPQHQQNPGFFTQRGPVTYIPHTSPAPHHAPSPSITYIGLHPSQQPVAAHTMADYQNTAPPPTGLNFQPPVPDTTFGPMQHVYVPRFDAGYVPGVQQHAPGGLAVSQPAYVVAQQPAFVQQQPIIAQQPVMVGGQPFVATGPPGIQNLPNMGVPGGVVVSGSLPIVTGNSGHIPEVSGLGRTQGEESLRQIKFAHANKMFEPQEFKPADDDPSRFYYVREVDGNWTQRNRFTIDRMGDCRWYVTDEGWFYAVRLPD